MGRQSKRTPAIVETILAGLRMGIPLAGLCRRPGMPSPETWRNWCRVDDDLEEAYEAARKIGYEVLMGEALDLVAGGASLMDPRIDNRLRLAAKWRPHIFVAGE